jgi:hypothetical protein
MLAVKLYDCKDSVKQMHKTGEKINILYSSCFSFIL